MKLQIHDGYNLALAAIFALISGLVFAAPNSGYESSYHRYFWLLWLALSALSLYRAFRPEKGAR